MQVDQDSERQPLTRHQENPVENIQTDRNVSGNELSQDLRAAKKKKYIKWGIIGALVLIALILVIVLPIVLTRKGGNNNGGDDDNGWSPQPPLDKQNPFAVDQGSIKNDQVSFSGVLNVGQQSTNPVQNSVSSSATTNDEEKSHKSFFHDIEHISNIVGRKFVQEKQDVSESPAKDDPRAPPEPSDKLSVDWTKSLKVDKNNKFAFNLKFNIEMLDYKVARFTLTDKDNERFSIPKTLLNKPDSNPTMRLEMLGFQYNLNPFSFSFTDVMDKENKYIDTAGQTLVFMDKYIQMDMMLPSQNIYGLGERIHEFGLKEGTYTMWAQGQDLYDDGKGRKGAYGVHPFIMVQSGKRKDDYFGIFFRNANAQSPIIRFNDDGTSTLSYITIGGQIEAYFFIHGSAKDVISQYHNVIGKPELPPFWAMGWQQASWKYTSQELAQAALDGYKNANMPLDVIYFDIPYMDKYADFSVDTKKFPDLKTFSQNLQKNNQKLVVIIDAAISAEDTENKYYQQGNKDGVFIQSAIHSSDKYGKNLIQKVWPKRAVFLDWLHEKVLGTWSLGLKDLFDQVAFDGLWLDMNEPSGFVDGEIDHNQVDPVDPPEPPKPDDPKEEVVSLLRNLQQSEQTFLIEAEEKPQETDKDDPPTPPPPAKEWFYGLNGNIKDTYDTYHLPFIVRNSEDTVGNWDFETLSLNATHPGFNNEREYNLHSLYGHMMAWRTRDFLEQQSDNRPFLLSRSTFASSGKFTSHWLGDNYRTWDYMRYSISGIMNMNMFGIPHSGADICGFFGEKLDSEMCLRWIQLATFYPFARSHQNLTFNDKPSDNTEPFNLKDKFLSDARASMYDRYAYLRMMYTCLFEVRQNGGSCFDPLFFHYPNDQELYKDYESSFMVANNLKVSPILSKLDDGVTTYDSYFPQGKWVNLADLTEVIDTTAGGKTVKLTVRPTINVHLKQGGLIPYQTTVDGSVKTTADLLQKPIQIIANRDASGHAEGTVFLDQGSSRKELQSGQYEHYQVKLQAKSFQFKLLSGQSGNQNHILSELLIADAADLKDVNFACGMDSQMKFVSSFSPIFVNDKKLLKLSPDSDKPLKFSDVANVYFGSSKNGDINLCDPLSYQYGIKGGVLPDLTKSSATVILQNIAGTSPDLKLTIGFIDTNIINVKWTYDGDKTPEGKRTPVEVPNDLVDTTVRGTPTQQLQNFVQITNKPFTVQFTPRNTLDKTPYFTLNGMLLDSYFNQINAKVTVPSGDNFKGIFGLGERASKNFFYEDGVYTIWGKDQGTPLEDGKAPAKAMYGTHPFFMFRHNKESFAGVFYKLAHAQDWYIKNNKETGEINLKTIATGGLGDIYIMTDAQNPQTIIERYYSIVGDPVLIPQWALGWNQCKWGYKSTDDLVASVHGYKDNKIPLDVQWSDIDYMSNYKDFTIDQNAFAKLPDFVNDLHKDNQRFVPILDIGVAMRPGQNYAAYEDGIKDDVFIKIQPLGAEKSDPFIGKVWPNEAHFPDFFNPKTTPWWHKQLSAMFDLVKFDGLWEDMNEVSNFCDGLCYDRQKPVVQVKNLLPYTPSGEDLEQHTASLDAFHANNYLQLDTHSYAGTQEVKATHEWFRDVQKQRTFIIERSSFAGMGKFGSRWLGDNSANYDQMGVSVTGIMLQHMFGIQLAGVDICGFNGDTNAELCARWHTLGAFYPFSRNHNSIGQKPQEPWEFPGDYEEGKKYIDIMRSAIQQKYSLIRYYYTQMFLASLGSSQNYRTAFYKPLFFEFPEDLQTYSDLQYNVMLGEALKLSINSDTQGSTTTDFYFPAGTWCDIHAPETKCLSLDTGKKVTLPSKAYDYGLHLRQGYLVPYQDAAALGAMTTVDLQNKPIDLHILGSKTSADNNNWNAVGVYVNDDGISLELTDNWNRYDFSVKGQFSDKQEQIIITIVQKVQAKKFKNKDEPTCFAVNQNDYLNQIYIYNADTFKKSDKFDVNGTTTDNKQVKLGSAVYDDKTKRIVFSRDDKVNVCLSSYSQIAFTPVQ